jgi:TonB family protein
VRGIVVAALVAGVGSLAKAQTTPSAACESIIASAKVGDAQAGIFISVQPLTPGVDEHRASRISTNIATGFVAPRPFKLGVFAGPSLVRGLRVLGADTAGSLRTPVITGIYRVVITADDPSPQIQILRRSLVDGFDSAAVAAVRDAATVPGVFAVGSGNPLAFDLSITSDSQPGALRLFAATFPQLPVKDAAVRTDTPAPKYPEEELGRGGQMSVMLRFVIARDGVAEPGTVEVVRSAPDSFLNAALQALAEQQFIPATVKGCPVAQQVDYPFAFLPPELLRKD